MKHLHSFNDYEKLDEGFKDWLTGALFLLSGTAISQNIPKIGIRNIDRRHYTSTIKKEYGEKDSVQKTIDEKRLLLQGWTQIASTIDTLWNETTIKKPDSSVSTLSLKFDSRVLFESGKFEVSGDIKSQLDSAFQQMIDQNGILTNVEIVSSTDKTPVGPKTQDILKSMGLKPDNSGLAEARSNSISDYLKSGVTIDGEKAPINDSLITFNRLVEQGTVNDPSARFVYVNITFLASKTEESETTQTVKTPAEKTTVYWQKEFKKERGGFHFKLPKIKFHLFNHGKIGNHKRNKVKCPTW